MGMEATDFSRHERVLALAARQQAFTDILFQIRRRVEAETGQAPMKLTTPTSD